MRRRREEEEEEGNEEEEEEEEEAWAAPSTLTGLSKYPLYLETFIYALFCGKEGNRVIPSLK